MEFAVSGLLVAAIAKGFGSSSTHVNPGNLAQIFRLLFANNFLGAFVSCLARISVALMLLQFGSSVTWKVILWVAIGFQIAVVFSINIALLLSCRPTRALFEVVPGAKCWNAHQGNVSAYVQIGKSRMSLQ
jgi:hypothetical protein